MQRLRAIRQSIGERLMFAGALFAHGTQQFRVPTPHGFNDRLTLAGHLRL